ncbi:hypothetical protein E2C01_032773 [Portunus trituberculatus]|uniref:Uncharacterized protein n=1 Tax=Portunus trituberculatus TaxID=210409 RepID=A0A5B7F2B3_PORTR|nr:hypothetical protein [Portunus trituberculatus]
MNLRSCHLALSNREGTRPCQGLHHSVDFQRWYVIYKSANTSLSRSRSDQCDSRLRRVGGRSDTRYPICYPHRYTARQEYSIRGSVARISNYNTMLRNRVS